MIYKTLCSATFCAHGSISIGVTVSKQLLHVDAIFIIGFPLFPANKEGRKTHNGIQPRHWIINEVCAWLHNVI